MHSQALCVSASGPCRFPDFKQLLCVMSCLASTCVRLLVLTLTLAVPRALMAQARWDVGPQVGIYVPLGILFDGFDQSRGVVVTKKQITTLVFGASVAFAITERWGLEGNVGYSRGLVAVKGPTSTVDVAASVAIASARGFLVISRPSPSLAVRLASGFALISRSGRAWSATRGTTDGAVVLAVGVRSGSPESRTAISFELEDYISWAQFDDSMNRLHQAVILQLGLAFRIGEL